MKRMKLTLVIAGMLAFGYEGIAQGTSKTLTVGDQAPAIKYSKWIKGEPVKSLTGEQLHVLEFWATWCGPCKMAMPHLTELQKKYKGKINIIGVGVWEKVPAGKPYESSLPFVERFVKGNDANMGYSVIADNNEQFMGNNWLRAAGENGIPSTFIVKDNKILWIGHPSSLDSIIPSILNGKYDINVTKAKFNKSAEASKKWAAERAATYKPIEDAIKEKQYDKAFQLMDNLVKEKPETKTSIDAMKFGTLLEVDEKKAVAFGKEMLLSQKSALAIILGAVYNRDGLSKETYGWVAESFDKPEIRNNPLTLDAVATCYAKAGDYKNAAAKQQLALEVAKTALKEGKMVGSVMDYTVTDYEEKVRKYKTYVK